MNTPETEAQKNWLKSQSKKIKQLEQENKELLCHIERLSKALEKLMVNVSYKYGYKLESQDANKVFNETPKHSLKIFTLVDDKEVLRKMYTELRERYGNSPELQRVKEYAANLEDK